MIKLCVVLISLCLCDVHGQRGSFMGTAKEPICVKVDNYCEENRDCCSKLCLAETHRCIDAGVSGIASNNSQPATPNPIANRFGDENKPCQQVATTCLLGRDCCSGQCSSDSLKCLESVPNRFGEVQGQGDQQETPVCSKENQQCSSSQGCCAFLSCELNVCRDKAVVIEGTETLGFKPSNNTLDNRFGEGDNATTTAPTNIKCLEIGSKCFKESECCKGLRCHGFLHQCVT